MSELSKIIWSKIDQVPVLGMYSLLLLINALSFNQNILMLKKVISHTKVKSWE